MTVRITPWGIVAAIFAAQFCGAVVVAAAFQMDFRDLGFQLIILFLGWVSALVFLRRDRDDRPNDFRWWIPPCLYALFIFLMSDDAYPDALPLFDTNIFHPIEYLTLAFLLGFAFDRVFRHRSAGALCLFVFCTGGFWAVCDEIHQSFVPGRTPTFADIAIDFLGIGAGCAVYLAFRRLPLMKPGAGEKSPA